jgi:hypothetical protein
MIPADISDTRIERDSTEEESTDGPREYQMNVLRGGSLPTLEDFDEFEDCFANVPLDSFSTPLSSNASTTETVSVITVPFSNDNIGTVCIQDTDRFLLRRLAETYDVPSRSVYAHADNGSMACTASDATILYAYRPLTASSFNHKVRLFDAGGHGHQPTGV